MAGTGEHADTVGDTIHALSGVLRALLLAQGSQQKQATLQAHDGAASEKQFIGVGVKLAFRLP